MFLMGKISLEIEVVVFFMPQKISSLFYSYNSDRNIVVCTVITFATIYI